jgi:hypothetical protein
VRSDLEQLLHCSLVKEAQTIAKYQVPAVEATLAALEEARDGAKLCVLRFLAEVGRSGWDWLGLAGLAGLAGQAWLCTMYANRGLLGSD